MPLPGAGRRLLASVPEASPNSQSFCGPSAYACTLGTDGGGIASRLIRASSFASNSLGAVTSASRKVASFECRVTFAPISISFSRGVVKVRWLPPSHPLWQGRG